MFQDSLSLSRGVCASFIFWVWFCCRDGEGGSLILLLAFLPSFLGGERERASLARSSFFSISQPPPSFSFFRSRVLLLICDLIFFSNFDRLSLLRSPANSPSHLLRERVYSCWSFCSSVRASARTRVFYCLDTQMLFIFPLLVVVCVRRLSLFLSSFSRFFPITSAVAAACYIYSLTRRFLLARLLSLSLSLSLPPPLSLSLLIFAFFSRSY